MMYQISLLRFPLRFGSVTVPLCRYYGYLCRQEGSHGYCVVYNMGTALSLGCAAAAVSSGTRFYVWSQEFAGSNSATRE